MSRSNPTPTNPANKFFTWKGSTGELVYYDKEKKENISVKLPFTFLVLDQLATVTGFAEQDQSSYWSNEVRNIVREELTVRTSAGTKQVGLYKDLADVRSKGAKYAKSIYISYKDGDEWVIGNIKASGAALTAWIELSNTCAVGNGKVTLTGSTEAKKGTTKYFVPTFKWDSSDTNEDEIAIELDKELQVYLSQYLAKRDDRVPAEDVDPELGKATPEQEADFAKRKAAKKDVVIEDIGDEPINLDDIPF